LTESLPSKQESFFEMMRESPELAQHGFELLTKRPQPEQYFDALKERGFFKPENNSGPVPSENPDFVHIPLWSAVPYLLAVARRSAEKGDDRIAARVLEVIREVSRFRDQSTGEPTDNYQTNFRFAEILGELPLHCIQLDDISFIGTWMTSRYDHSMIVHTLEKGLLRRLLASGQRDDIEKACALVRECVAFEWSSKGGSRPDKELVTRGDDYWLKEMLKTNGRTLGALAGIEAVSIFGSGLRAIFTDQRRSLGSMWWRPAIEDNEQNRDWNGPENRFVEGMRETLEGWFENNPDSASSYIEKALKDDVEVIRRIALYMITEHFDVLRDTFERNISTDLFTSAHRHELYRLIELHFAKLSASGKTSILDALRTLAPPSVGEEPERRRKFIQREWLSAIKNHAEVEKWFSELVSDPELGAMTEHPEFLSYFESRSGPGPTPFGEEALLAFAEDGSLIQRLNEFTEKDSWRGPTLGGLVSALEGAVAGNPTIFVPLLEAFQSAKIAFRHAVIQGFKNLFDNPTAEKQDFDWGAAWPKLIAFFVKTTNSSDMWVKTGNDEEGDLVPTNAWMRTLIASFLEAGTRDDKTAYPASLLPQGWEVIQILLERAQASTLSLKDPMTHALNTEKGHAVGALYNHALRLCRLEKAKSNSTVKAWAAVEKTFTVELQKCQDGNYDFSTLSAAYIVNLAFMSHQWLQDNVPALFPAKYPSNFKVAIGGLAYAKPSRRLYQMLAARDIFARALDIELEDRQGRERVIEWIALAYLWDDEELEAPVIEKVFSSGAKDLEIMSNLFWVVRRDSLSEEQKAKVLAFWDRCNTWSHTQTRSQGHLLSRLARLAVYLDTLDEAGVKRLLNVVPFVHIDHATDFTVKQLARFVEAKPAETAQILEAMLQASSPRHDFGGELQKLIESLVALGQRDAAVRCVEMIGKTLPNALEVYKRIVMIR
jgi:hypothetical protein